MADSSGGEWLSQTGRNGRLTNPKHRLYSHHIDDLRYNGEAMTDPITFGKAIADETRQKIMNHLCCQWLCVSDVVDMLGGVSQPTVSHHLAILRDAGLVHTRREGKQIFYSLNQDAVAICCGTLMQKFAPEVVLATVGTEK